MQTTLKVACADEVQSRPRDPKTVRGKKREIAVRYTWQHKKRRREYHRARIGALTKVFGGAARYGDGKLYQFADDDAGREDLRILLDHYAYSNPVKDSARH